MMGYKERVLHMLVMVFGSSCKIIVLNKKILNVCFLSNGRQEFIAYCYFEILFASSLMKSDRMLIPQRFFFCAENSMSFCFEQNDIYLSIYLSIFSYDLDQHHLEVGNLIYVYTQPCRSISNEVDRHKRKDMIPSL